MPKTTKPRRGAVTRALADTDEGKRYPQGIADTFRVVQEYWMSVLDNDKELNRASVKDFVRDGGFRKAYDDALDLYPGAEKRAPKLGLDQAIGRMARGQSDMDYYRLRALAHYLNLSPAGLVLIFAQLVGEERRARRQKRNPADACLAILDGIERVIVEMKSHIRRPRQQSEFIMLRRYRPKDDPLPDVLVLKKWVDAYNAGKLPPDAFHDLDQASNVSREDGPTE